MNIIHERTATAIIPIYNENLTVSSVMFAAAKADYISEIIAVDDGSNDGSLDVINCTAEEIKATSSKDCIVITHESNRGKAESLISGANIAKAIGGTSLHTLVFLDADLSPLSSRNTPQNQKIGTNFFHQLFKSNEIESKYNKNDFELSLSRHISNIVRPVLEDEMIMNIGMLHRTETIDALRLALNWGALSGNRALTVELWDSMLKSNLERGLVLQGWEVEAALNTYCRINRDKEDIKLNRKIGKFVMDDIVNVGSRVKSGSLLKGLSRMSKIHFKAMSAFIKYA